MPVVYHAGGDRGLSHGVADVEAFDALRRLGQAERLAQRHDTRFLRRFLPRTLQQRQARILFGHGSNQTLRSPRAGAPKMTSGGRGCST